MSKCQGCDKEATGYKWCAECTVKARKAADRRHNEKRVQRRNTPCEECKDTLTRTKYCKPCSQIVKVRKERERRNIPTKKCADCNADILQRKTYCDNCRIDRAYHTQVRYNKPEVAECKELTKTRGENKDKGSINPMFLVRGLVSNTCRSDSITNGQ